MLHALAGLSKIYGNRMMAETESALLSAECVRIHPHNPYKPDALWPRQYPDRPHVFRCVPIKPRYYRGTVMGTAAISANVAGRWHVRFPDREPKCQGSCTTR